MTQSADQILFDLMNDEKLRDVAQSRWFIKEAVTNARTGRTQYGVWAEDVNRGLPFRIIDYGEGTDQLVWLEYVVALHNEQLDRAALVNP